MSPSLTELMKTLNTTFGIQHIRSSPYQTQANGMVERFHRTLKVALTAHESPHWTQHLPIVFLALRITVIQDVGAAPADLVYGTSLRLPGELFHAAPTETSAHDLVTSLRKSMAKLRPTQGSDHDSSRRIFVRIDAHHVPLQPRYEGPYAVLERRLKDFKLQLGNRTSWISVDRLKPAFVLRDDPRTDHSYAVQAVNQVPATKGPKFYSVEGE